MDRDAHYSRNTQPVRDVLPRLSDRSDALGASTSSFATSSLYHAHSALDIFANAEKLPAHPSQKLLNQDSHTTQQSTLPPSQASQASQGSHHAYYGNGTSNDSQDTNSSADTSASTDTDRLFTPALSEAELSTGGGGSGSVNGSTTVNSYSVDNDPSSQESQLHQLSRLAATRQRMDDATTPGAGDGAAASRKRTADGSVKESATSPVFGAGFGHSHSHGHGHGHSRNTSTLSVSSAAAGRIGELSAELKTRLSYAMVKVNNGWQTHSLDQVETLTQNATSPSSSAPAANGHGRHGASASPRIQATRPPHRRHQSFASQSTVSAASTAIAAPNSRTALPGHEAPPAFTSSSQQSSSHSAQSTPPLASPLAPPRTGITASSSAQPARSLAPPATIQPSRPSSLSRRNSNPAYVPPPLAHSYSQGASPHTPAFDQTNHHAPTMGERMVFSPHQNVREQDAIETLLFMSSPGNSANMKNASLYTSASQPLPSGHNEPQRQLQSPLAITTTASPQRHALPNGPRKSLPSGRPHAQTFSGSQLYAAGGRGRGHSRTASDMVLDDPYVSPYARSNKGTPKRRANGADMPTPRIRVPLPMSSGLSVKSKPRPVLDEDDIEKMLDRAAAASADDSSDSESEILIPSRRPNHMGVLIYTGSSTAHAHDSIDIRASTSTSTASTDINGIDIDINSSSKTSSTGLNWCWLRMLDALPIELVMMIRDILSPAELARLSRVNRAYQRRWDPWLYRIHAVPRSHDLTTVIAWAAACAVPEQPETCALSEAWLAKVERLCHLQPGDVDRGVQNDGMFKNFGKRRDVYRITEDDEFPEHCISMKYLPPLHIAVHRGVDSIVSWLLRHGADAYRPLRMAHNLHCNETLYLAVERSHLSTAQLLLTHGVGISLAGPPPPARNFVDEDEAEKVEEATSYRDGHWGYQHEELWTVVHLACSTGCSEMVELLLRYAHTCNNSWAVHPDHLLSYHVSHLRHDQGSVVEVLVRHGAQYTKEALSWLAGRQNYKTIVEFFAATEEPLTASLADELLQEMPTWLTPGPTTLEHQRHVVQMCLDAGADANRRGDELFCGGAKWFENSCSYILEMLPLFLKAGMTVRKKQGEEEEEEEKPRRDCLGAMSQYEEMYSGPWATKLAIMRLLLQHGAPIQEASRRHALDDYRGVPEDTAIRSRENWAYQVCQVLLEHCHSTPADQRGADMETFLASYAAVCKERGKQEPASVVTEL